MSFCSEQKKAITEEKLKNFCCRRSLFQGALIAKGESFGKQVSLSVDNASKSYFSELARELYGKTPDVSPCGGRRVMLSFESGAAAKYLGETLSSGEIHVNTKCAGCLGAFLRGVFLASGRISNPEKQYCLEFSLGTRQKMLLDFLESMDIHPGIAHRASGDTLYIKRTSMLEDFFAYAGMNQMTFHLMNLKIRNEFRNNANRVKNCDSINIAKTVSAAGKQLLAIERLEAAGLLSSLSEELEATARLRLEHRELSIAQLAALTTPKISKPGLSHRLARIIELADEMLPDKNN